MNGYGLVMQNGPLVVTHNHYLKAGIESFLNEKARKRCLAASHNAIFIDVESLKFVSDPGVILKYAVDHHCPVIFICSSGEMSMVFRGKFPHLDARDTLLDWCEQLASLLSADKPLYYLKVFNDFLLLQKLGPVRLIILSLMNQGFSFDAIAQELCLPQKSLYRYINGLVSYFDVKNASFLFSLLRDKFPSHYFSSRFRPQPENALPLITGKPELLA